MSVEPRVLLRRMLRYARTAEAQLYLRSGRGVRLASPPAFIVGCGRSGTTIFGRVLSGHPDVCYLNEPRHLWIAAIDRSDVWSRLAARRGGRLVLDGSDADPTTVGKLSRLFQRELERSGRRLAVEKLPANSFRVGFLRAAFPAARFVHLVRHPASVAQSIARQVPTGWFGARDYKWHQLSALWTAEHSSDLPTDDYLRGLVEWRLSVDHIERHFTTRDQVLTVRYEDLTERPADVMVEVQNFLGLRPSSEVAVRSAALVTRGGQAFDGSSQRELLITGDAARRYGYA